MTSPRFGFIGTGRMASALAQGMIKGGLATADALCGSDPIAESAEGFRQATGATIVASNRAVASQSDVLFICVKPQQMNDVLQELHGQLNAKHLVISIAAGIELAKIQSGLGSSARLVRVMPNTPCLVGQGASGYCLGRGATADDAALVERLLSSVGCSVRVDEKLLDAVTGLSGSGPAYVFIMIEALADAGVRVGLPRAVAQTLAAQTVLGSAQMVLSTGEHPAVLKDQVASPGGTTIAGIAALESRGLRGALIAAVEAATARASELGKK